MPAYACLWYARRWLAAHRAKGEMSWMILLRLSTSLTLAATAAVLISNSSFYLLSGRFPELSWRQYSAGVERYYWGHLKSAYVYAGAMALIHIALLNITRSRLAGCPCTLMSWLHIS
jgi:hypothetical protein